MFGLPIEKITFADVDAFCRSGVREGVLLDFKKDFPARLEKTIASFANTYGGIILIGVDETPTGAPVVPVCGVALVPGLRERVIQIGLDSIYPPLIPEVKVVDFKSADGLTESDRAVVVARVHESEIGGHAVDKRTTVYLRVENVSDYVRKATMGEVEWFINKREKALQEKSRILHVAREHASQYLMRLRTRHGMSTSEPAARCVFWTVPRFPRQPLASPQELLNLAYELRWTLELHAHLFPLGSVLPVREGIFFDGNYYSALRYTEIQQQGLSYHQYGFWWHKDSELHNLVLPTSITELMLSAIRYGTRLYSTLGYWGLVDFEFSLLGVKGLQFHEPTGFPELLSTLGAVDNEITVRESASVSELVANGIEVARRMMTDIAWAFGVESCPSSVDNFLAKAKI